MAAMVEAVPQNHQGLNARQRKQVYMHSAIFDTTGKTAGSVYAPAKQAVVWSEVNRHINTQSPERGLNLPSPADMKVTMNTGHGVVMPQGSSRAGPDVSRRTLHVNTHENFVGQTVVHANREEAAIPKEFRNTSTKLEWCDPRSERLSCRGKDKIQERATLDPTSRKHYELSSEIFGKTAPHHPREPKETERAVENKPPPHSARERMSNHLNPSCESQFYVGAQPSSPLQESRDTNHAQAEERRRTERNYSDLFGKPTDRKTSPSGPRSELHSTANVDFLNFHVEVASRRRDHRRSPPPNTRATVCARPMCASPERACWDTRSIMDSTAEVARRRRERAEAGGEVEKTASERKRVDMASGQLRQGMGAAREPHDEGTGSPSRARQFRCTLSPVSARDRKLTSLSSEGLF